MNKFMENPIWFYVGLCMVVLSLCVGYTNGILAGGFLILAGK